MNVDPFPGQLVGARLSDTDAWRFPIRVAARHTQCLDPEKAMLYADPRSRKAAILLDTIPPTASVQIQVNTLTVRGSVPDEVEKVLDGSLVSVRAGTNAARFSAFLPDRSQKIEWACPLEDVEAVWQGNTNTWVVRLVGCIHRIQGDGYTPAYLSGRRPPRSS